MAIIPFNNKNSTDGNTNSAFSSLHNWTTQHLRRPSYEALPSADQHDQHDQHQAYEAGVAAKEEAIMADGGGLLSGTASAPSTPGQSFGLAGFSSGGSHKRSLSSASASPAANCVRLLILGPALLLRSIYLIYLLLTDPLRRQYHRAQAVWPSFYARLGMFRFLVPSFMHPNDTGSARKLHPSAWLDGLRGVAAFLVVWHHASLLWFSWRLHRGYGSAPENNLLIQLPIIRIVLAGPPQVAVFFVISGYALSYKPLKLARQRRFAEAGEAIQSSVFRRHPRLFLMPVFVSFVAALMIHFNLYGTKEDGWEGVAAAVRRPPRASAGLVAQLIDWAKHVRNLTNPLSRNMDRGRPFGYDANLWTLPVEFDCSMVVFLCQAAFCRLRPRIRMGLLVMLMLYAQAWVYWRLFLFLAGMFLCDLHFHLDGTGAGAAHSKAAPTANGHGNGAAEMTEVALGGPASIPLADQQQHPGSSSSSIPGFLARRTTSRFVLSIVFALTALYFLSIPDKQGGESVGFRTLYVTVPEAYQKSGQPYHFWISIGAAMLVFIVDRTPALQRIFTTAFAQYLGTISYSMYLVHGPLIWTAGHWIVRHTTAITGTATDTQYFLGIVLAAAGLWPIIIYCADAVTRGVDVRAVAFGRWLYERWSVNEPEPPVLPHSS